MSKLDVWQWGSWVAAGLILVSLAIQYPLLTTFPMGGDAAQYITTARLLLSSPQHPSNVLKINHWYPIANLLLVPFKVLPVSWPERYTWWATLGQIAVGAALGWLGYRLAGWQAGAASAAFWGLTPIVGTSHFTDGTIAQLWSYVFFCLCLERLHSRQPWATLLLLGITGLTHPITGFALLFILLLINLPLWLNYQKLTSEDQRLTRIVSAGLVGIGAVGLLLLWKRQSIFNFVYATPVTSSVPVEIWRSVLAPLVFLAPVGLVGLLEHWRRRPVTILMLVSLTLVTIFLSTNNLLGLSVWIGRLAPLFILLITIVGSVGWPALMRLAFPQKFLRVLVTILFFGVLALMVWQQNKPVYAHYESGSRYARIHPDELAAVQWLGEHTTEHSYVISTALNRHTEWITALTDANWYPAGDVRLEARELERKLPADTDAEYIIFFLKREPVPQLTVLEATNYNVVYTNQHAVIWQLPVR